VPLDSPTPGLVRRDLWARSLPKPVHDMTARRWQRAGKIVVIYPFGRTPYVDVEATAARARGLDRPRSNSAQRRLSKKD